MYGQGQVCAFSFVTDINRRVLSAGFAAEGSRLFPLMVRTVGDRRENCRAVYPTGGDVQNG